jgi:hypothetical protein
MKKTWRIVLAVILFSAAPIQGFALVAPWWMAYGKLVHTVGLNPRVTVDEPVQEKSTYRIYIRADNSDHLAAALKILLNDTIDATEIIVLDGAGQEIDVSRLMSRLTPELIKQGMEIAFGSSQYFHGAETAVDPFVHVHFVAERDLIQFFIDDIGKPHGRATYSAQDLFDMILKDMIGEFRISCSTRFFLSPAGADLPCR